MKGSGKFRFGLLLASLLLMVFAGCGGPSICDCEDESDKENPDKEIMEKCRQRFAEMEMDEVMAELKDCEK